MISIENYHRLRTEVTTNWKTGVVMVSVAVIAGQVYGKAAAAGVVLITVSNYQIVGRQIEVISWMSLRKFLIVAVMLGNNHYFNVMSPQIMVLEFIREEKEKVMRNRVSFCLSMPEENKISLRWKQLRLQIIKQRCR